MKLYQDQSQAFIKDNGRSGVSSAHAETIRALLERLRKQEEPQLLPQTHDDLGASVFWSISL